MAEALHFYFAELRKAAALADIQDDNTKDEPQPSSWSRQKLRPPTPPKRSRQQQISCQFEIIFDNARVPRPTRVKQHNKHAGMFYINDSCHTRSTLSTCASTLSGRSYESNGNNSTHSHASIDSTGSNNSTSCRWDSNPSSRDSYIHSEGTLAGDTGLRRPKRDPPKRPGRTSSGNFNDTGSTSTIATSCPNTSPNTKPKSTQDRLIKPKRRSSGGLGQRSSSCSDFQTSSNENNDHDNASKLKAARDKPRKPRRSSSNDMDALVLVSDERRPTSGTASSNSKRTLKPRPQRQQSAPSLSIDEHGNSNSNCQKPKIKKKRDRHKLILLKDTSDSTEPTVCCSSESDASSETSNSLKDIFRSGKRRSAGSKKAAVSFPGTVSTTTSGGGSPNAATGTRTVNEILGQSMEELKITW